LTGPDLVETAVGNPPPTAARGSRFYVSDTVRNQGTVRADRSTTRFYLSLDATKTAGDILLSGSRSIGRLSAGTSSSGNTRIRVPAGAALELYYVLVCADDTSQVPESNELNNCRVSATRVLVN